MDNIYAWITFFGAPLLLLAIGAFVYRPSARKEYQEAKMVPFAQVGDRKTTKSRG